VFRYRLAEAGYELNTAPHGIPAWFIVRLHLFTASTHWRTGVLRDACRHAVRL
jgi:hypothetical protein